MLLKAGDVMVGGNRVEVCRFLGSVVVGYRIGYYLFVG